MHISRKAKLHEVGRESLHNVERRLLNAASLQSKLRTLGIHVADVAMVDVPGCVHTHPLSQWMMQQCVIFVIR